jgi:primary-amine oxidase
MTTNETLPLDTITGETTQHPLNPLTPEEILSVVEILKVSGKVDSRCRFASIALHEPPKEIILNYMSGNKVAREAFVIILDNKDGATYEAIVSLDEKIIAGWKHIPGVQPTIMLDEFFECEEAVKNDPTFQAALLKRGITDFDLLMVDPWSAGNYGAPEEQNIRLSRALCWVRSEKGDNGYARPIEGLLVLVDLNEMKVVRVDDNGVVPLPPTPGNYSQDYIKEFRQDLKSIEINQPEGASFKVDGHAVEWQKWRFRVGFTPREGLVLHTISYEDQGRIRPVMYRAALSEMIVPYGDPHPNNYRKNAFDVGEYGIGNLANSLSLGCDCLGEIRYFDAFLSTSRGEVMEIKNAICMHEEDYGILWKHVDWRTNQTEVRRSRRLVVSFIATVGNYEYGFFWYFYQDGSIQYEVKLTGIMNTAALPAGETRKYGTLIAPQLYAPNHQHFFNVRMDMMLDGIKNSIYEIHAESEEAGPENPYGNAFYAKSTLLKTEKEAQQLIDPLSGRYWKIVNPNITNSLGQPVGYKLMHGENVSPFALPSSSIYHRANFMTKHLWVTPYHPAENYAAGDYPNQHPGGAGLPEWTATDRSIENTDIVVWYTMGHLHVPRPEDWPVMPAAYIGFMLKPVGFFDRSPALDVPPSASKHACHGCDGSSCSC